MKSTSWEDNQKEIRRMLNEIETLANEMVYVDDIEAKSKLWVRISKDAFDVLTRTENMARQLKR